ncbi:hypothetical protein J6590_100195, partial [Homalodisca vitripennis]
KNLRVFSSYLVLLNYFRMFRMCSILSRSTFPSSMKRDNGHNVVMLPWNKLLASRHHFWLVYTFQFNLPQGRAKNDVSLKSGQPCVCPGEAHH